MKVLHTIKVWVTQELLQRYSIFDHILQIAISPDQKFIVSVGCEGAIFIWHTPEKVLYSKADKDMPEYQQQ